MPGQRRRYVLKVRGEGVEETRRRVVAAARDALFTLPFEDVTLPLVANRAGVTTQTVRNHFDSKEGLLAALARALSEELLGARRAAAPADSAAVANLLAAEYETYGRAAARLLAATEQSPGLAAMAARGRREHQRWLEATFAGWLPADRSARRHVLAALYAATDVGTWRLLRLDLGHSRRMTSEVMRSLIDGALSSSGGTAQRRGRREE